MALSSSGFVGRRCFIFWIFLTKRRGTATATNKAFREDSSEKWLIEACSETSIVSVVEIVDWASRDLSDCYSMRRAALLLVSIRDKGGSLEQARIRPEYGQAPHARRLYVRMEA